MRPSAVPDHTHDPAMLHSARSGTARASWCDHLRQHHSALAAQMTAIGTIEDPAVPVGELERFSQVYVADCHDLDHTPGITIHLS